MAWQGWSHPWEQEAALLAALVAGCVQLAASDLHQPLGAHCRQSRPWVLRRYLAGHLAGLPLRLAGTGALPQTAAPLPCANPRWLAWQPSLDHHDCQHHGRCRQGGHPAAAAAAASGHAWILPRYVPGQPPPGWPGQLARDLHPGTHRRVARTAALHRHLWAAGQKERSREVVNHFH